MEIFAALVPFLVTAESLKAGAMVRSKINIHLVRYLFSSLQSSET